MSPISTCLRLTTVGAALILCSFVNVAPAQSAGSPAKPNQAIPVQALVPTAPIVFHGDGSGLLCYEIYLTNMSKEGWVLQRITATVDGGPALLKVDGKDLQNVLSHPGRPDLKGDALYELAPGERVIAFLWIKLSATVPKQLKHELIFRKSGDDKLMEMNAVATEVSDVTTTIASPLRGKNWLAAGAPSNTSDHRLAIVVIDGTPHIAQRYAIDWVQIDEKGSTYKGAAKDNRNYYCYGAEALAAADATVVEVKDGIPENTPGEASHAVEITLDTVAGNHVNLDLGGGVFAMYAHFQPGSIRVKVGDKVSRGQVLGLVGNSGNSSEPHLHFQLMDRNSPLGSEGLPYKMEFRLTGHSSGLEHPTIDRLRSPRTEQGEMPLENEIVDF
jgi:biotin carboxyl carrier protein